MMSTTTLVKTGQSNNEKGQGVFAGTDERQAAGNGRSIVLPDEAGHVGTWLLLLVVTSGSGKVQWTIDESLAIWHDWDAGLVTVNTSDVLYGVKAVRCVNVTGTVKLYVRAY